MVPDMFRSVQAAAAVILLEHLSMEFIYNLSLSVVAC